MEANNHDQKSAKMKSTCWMSGVKLGQLALDLILTNIFEEKRSNIMTSMFLEPNIVGTDFNL